jgi:GTP-binding protein Era
MPPTAPRSGTVAILGRPNVGKSTLLNAALRERLAIVTPIPQTTRDRILGVVRFGSAQIALIDTPGLHRARSRLGRHMNAIARDAAREADAVVFMVAVPPSAEHLAPHPGDTALLGALGDPARVVFVINKVDRLKQRSALLPFIDAWSRLASFAAVVPISARREDGIPRVLDEVAKLLPERGPVYAEDFLTDRPVRFFASEYVREQVILATRQEVPHHVAVTIERFDETGKVVHIEATIHCAKESQRPILLGAGGNRIREIGTAARQRIEEMLERQVNLKLWIEVDEAWQDSSQALGVFGYDGSGRDDGGSEP